MSTDGQRARCHLSKGLFSDDLNQHNQAAALATTAQQEEDVPLTIDIPRPEGSQVPDPSDSPAHYTGTPPLPVPPFLDITFVGTPPFGHSSFWAPLFGIQGWPLAGKVELLPQHYPW